MIDITGLREDKRPQSSTIVHALLDRLEAAENDVALKERVIDALGSELNAVANERDALRNEIACVKEVEFPRKAQAVADAWKGKCERLEAECDALRAKIAEMEQQEPVGVLHVGSCYGEELQDWEFEANQCACDKLNEAYVSNPTSLPLYALPGAQPAPSNLAEAIIEDLQAQYDTEGITENDSGDALIRLSDAIAAVEDNFVLAQPATSVPENKK